MRIQLVAAALLVSSTASAWSRRTTETDIGPAVVHGKLEGPVAVFTVRYVIPVSSAMYTAAFTGIDLPALGLVTSAAATSNGIAHTLGILPAEEAGNRFGALADVEEGVVTGRDKTNAITITSSTGRAEIGLASAHAGVFTIDVTIAAPTCFYRDARYISVPASWTKVADFALRRMPVNVKAVTAACEPADDDGVDEPRTWIGFAAPELTRKPSGDRIGAFAGRLPLGEDHIVRVELGLAGQLGDVPRDLATVVLVDGSRSMSSEEAEAQRQLVASYLKVAPESRVQVLAYARNTRPLLPGWTSAAQAAARVDRELRSLAPRNGSNFDTALADAATWLERIQGTRRIVLVTDERMADRLEATPPATLRRLLPPGTLVQVVAVDAQASEPRRDEDAKLAPLAAATDGMAVRLGPLDDPKQLDTTLLVRPISLDMVKIKASGWTELELSSDRAHCGSEPDGLLREGQSCTWWGEGDVSSGPVVVEGLVWGKRVQRLLRPDAGRARDVARELSARDVIDEKLKEKVDGLARAVNDHWSLYAEWGGSAKYASGTGFGMSGGGSGCGCGGSHDVGIGRATRVGGWEPPDLASQLRPLLAACHVEDIRISVTLEMTLVEIVDLTASLDFPNDAPAAVRRKQQTCVEEALWDAAPMVRHVEPRASYNVTLEAKR
jgi:von Willebrand factor type A domain